jgi:type IV secretion system protein VirB11
MSPATAFTALRWRNDVYLGSCLAPLAPYLSAPDITDIFINRPGEVWVEALGQPPRRHEVAELSANLLERLARQVAALNAQGISRVHPLLSGALPDGSRIQIILPPATRGDVAIAIRKHVSASMRLDDFLRAGAFDEAAAATAVRQLVLQDTGTGAEAMRDRLARAVKERRNILISGGTSTGKTTFLNALLHEIEEDERLVLIEDTPELQMTHSNAVGLLAVRGGQGEAEVTAEDLLIASLRMRPDRIILGELRGREATTFLRAVNTGHPGSLTTIHADSPERAIDQLALLVLQSGSAMNWDVIVRYIRHSISVVVQLERKHGVRRIVQVMEL